MRRGKGVLTMAWKKPIVLVCLAALGAGLVATGGEKPGDQPVGADLRLSIAAVDSFELLAGTPDFRVTIENMRSKDVMVNLGVMLANGKVMVPNAIRLVLTDAQGESRTYHCKGQRVGGRMDDLVVPLPAGSLYSLRLSLDDYMCAESMESLLKLEPGEYRIHAELEAKGAQCLNSDTEGMELMNYWIGNLESDAVTFRIAEMR